MKRFLLGVDLAKSLDFTSFAVIEMETPDADSDPVYHLIALDRIRGIEYPIITSLIVETIKRLEKESGTDDGPHLCLDASGLGAPIKDYLNQGGIFEGKKEIYPCVSTPGEAARYNPVTKNYNISKTLIVSNFLSLMQHRRFDYSQDLQALADLEREIASFKRHLTPSGNTTFGAEAGAHDDLISAICIPLIIGEWHFRANVVPICFPDALDRRSPFRSGSEEEFWP